MKNIIGLIREVVGGQDDYIGSDSMTRWIIEKFRLLRISESIRAYANNAINNVSACSVLFLSTTGLFPACRQILEHET